MYTRATRSGLCGILGVAAIVVLTACDSGGGTPDPDASAVEAATAVGGGGMAEIVSAGALEVQGLDGVFREIGYAPMPDGVRLAYIAYRPGGGRAVSGHP